MNIFAKIGLNNKVIDRVVVHNNELLDANNESNENLGISFLTNLTDGTRKNQAGIGYTYDENRDAFIPPKPFNSWTLNETTCQWEAPVVYPTDGQIYNWNEETKQWDLNE